MTLEKSFQDAMLQTEDIYQLIAVCYNKLLCYHNDSDMVFLAQVGNLRQDMFFRSHAEEFEDLRQKLVDLACQMDVRDDCDGIGFETFQCRLLQMMNQFPCPKDLAENICMDSYTYRNGKSKQPVNVENCLPIFCKYYCTMERTAIKSY